ncbi:MAG: OmpA family protein [Clostridia bacterium]|nr:OmpA family protein [Clostridia bacterium]
MVGKQKAQKDNSERWLLTYSDLMNLLLILFIVLYSISQVDQKKMEQVAQAIRSGFNNDGKSLNVGEGKSSKAGSYNGASSKSSSTASSAVSVASSAASLAGQYDKLYQSIMSLIVKNNLNDRVTVQLNKSGVIISLNNNVLFTPGSAELSTDSVSLIVSIGNVLKNIDYSQIIVEGYTDSDPIHTALYKDNRDLSSERANNVSRILQYNCGISPELISALGYGEYHPVAPNDTPENKAKNRRVVITILKPQLDADTYVSLDGLASTVSSAESQSGSSAASAASSSQSASSTSG